MGKDFWDRVNKEGPTIYPELGPCWVVEGSDYGRVYLRGKTIKAHRYSWELHNGPIPEGLWVLHKCDNRPCVNPSHLFLGTQQDNMRDAWNKGRLPLPENKGKTYTPRKYPRIGKPHTEETKRKIGEAQLGRPRSVETRKRMSEAHQRRLYDSTNK